MKPTTISRRGFLRTGTGGLAASALIRRARGQEELHGEVPLPPIPYERSSVIKGIRWLGRPVLSRNDGDVWTTTWADDDNLYCVADDTSGTGPVAWNLSIYRVDGTPPGHVVGGVNEMREYGKRLTGHWWKGAGLASIDGVLYLGIYSQSKPDRRSATAISFNADNSSIIKSLDRGRTWQRTATFETPMFPGKEFPTPFFVQYGKDYAGAMDDYVYAISNDGGWNNWNRMILARVPRKKIRELDRLDWEFFGGIACNGAPTWIRESAGAASVFEHKGYTSMAGIQYVPAVKRFVLGQWAYISMYGEGDHPEHTLAPPWTPGPRHEQSDQTMLCLYEAAKPWGPWRLFHSQVEWSPAFYNPSFPSKWFSGGGRRMWVVESGDYRGPERPRGYNFTVQQLELVL